MTEPIHIPAMSKLAEEEPSESERRVALIHRVLVPEENHPEEYAILVTDRRSIFIRQPKTRSDFWLRGEMRWGTALITDVPAKTLQDYENTDLGQLANDPMNIASPHSSLDSLVLTGDKPTSGARDFWVRWTMQRQKAVFQVYNFEMAYRKSPGQTNRVKFYAVPLGVYVKPRRQTQTRETILKEYAQDILDTYRRFLPERTITALSDEPSSSGN